MKKPLVVLIWMVILLSVSTGVKAETDKADEIKVEVDTPDLVEACAANASYSESPYFLENYGLAINDFENYPQDIKCFAENAALCEHFAGEEAYDEARGKDITHALEKYCAAAQKQSAGLKKKYMQNTDFIKILMVCDEGSPAVCASFSGK
ncbi:MAG: hypothetical protein LBJ59_04790 [Zoogloeaceae bacterium]|jgi:hypothetical protein|nr:hypothetical protein [Zoogloeaceae bacterium]